MAETNDRFAKDIIGLYERHAAAWDRDRQTSWNDKIWHARFAKALPKDGSLLDLGCGSGVPVAQHLAEHGFQVTGVDASPTLISLASGRLPDQEWIVSDMRGLSLGRRFDGVLAWDSFFHLPAEDQRGMFAVFAQHAAAKALLMFSSGSVFGEAIGSYQNEPLYHASLSSDEYETLLAQHGFTVLDHITADPEAGGRAVWLAQFN